MSPSLLLFVPSGHVTLFQSATAPRLIPVNLALVRSVSIISAPVRLGPVKLAYLRLAYSDENPPLRFGFVKLSLLKFPPMAVPLRFAFVKFAPTPTPASGITPLPSGFSIWLNSAFVTVAPVKLAPDQNVPSN